MCFRKFKLLSNTTPRFFADADGCVSLPRIRHGNYLRFFFSQKFGPNEKKFCLTRIRLQLKSCHPGRHGLYTVLQLKIFLSVGKEFKHVNLSIKLNTGL